MVDGDGDGEDDALYSIVVIEPVVRVAKSFCEAEEMDRQDLAALSPGEKLAQALELMEWGIRLKRGCLREEHPAASEEEVDRLLTEWLCRG